MRVAVADGADIAALVRATAGGAVTLVIDEGQDLGAMIASLAIERAPATRVNAVLVGAGAAPADVDAAVAFLEHAASTTGQLLRIRPHGPSDSRTNA